MQVYDFTIKTRLRRTLSAMTAIYCLATVCWAFLCTMAVVALAHMLWLGVMLAGILTMCFAVASLLFWNITYGRLRKYYRFLDNAETGDRRDIAVTFNGESDCVQRYGLTFKRFDVTDMNGGQLLVLVEHSVETPFVNGAKYLFTCAGDMLIAYKKL